MSTSYLIKGSKATRFSTPESVQREIVSFDRHNDFESGTYKLIPKAPSSRLHVERPKSRIGGKNKNTIRVYHKITRIRTFNLDN